MLLKEEDRFLALEGDDKYRLECFDAHVGALLAKELEQKEMEREKKKAAEKVQRQAFT